MQRDDRQEKRNAGNFFCRYCPVSPPSDFIRRLATLGTLILFVSIHGLNDAAGDLIKLKNGGELRGRIVEGDDNGSGTTLTVETLTGTVIAVEPDAIQFVIERPLLVEEYESLARSAPDTIEGQWNLSEWCREHNLEEQRKDHLNRIVELNPEHKKAHYALGHTKRGGKWMSRDEYMLSQGYVKHKGKYVTRQELDLIEKSTDELEAEKEWFKKVRVWLVWLNGDTLQRRETAYNELRAVTDPNAVAALTQFMQNDENRNVRALFVDILTHIPGKKPVRALVASSLLDVDQELRSNAINSLTAEQYAEAIPLYVDGLGNESNAVVCRSASALGRIGDERVVPALIDALVTSHRYQVQVPEGTSFTFGSNGSIGAPNGIVLPPAIELGLRAGQFPYGVIVERQPIPGENLRVTTVTVKREHQNSTVLTALKKLTDEDLGYNERTWRLWWAAKKADAGKIPGQK